MVLQMIFTHRPVLPGRCWNVKIAADGAVPRYFIIRASLGNKKYRYAFFWKFVNWPIAIAILIVCASLSNKKTLSSRHRDESVLSRYHPNFCFLRANTPVADNGAARRSLLCPSGVQPRRSGVNFGINHSAGCFQPKALPLCAPVKILTLSIKAFCYDYYHSINDSRLQPLF